MITKEDRARYARTWRAKFRERANLYVRNSYLKTHYGINVDERDALRIKQDNRCAFCGGLFEGTCRDKFAPVIDHDHESNKIRGLVHQRCNRVLIAANTPKTARRLVEYLGE
jgi:hypothetical protein